MSIRDGSLPEHVEDVGTRVVDAAFQVYSLLGPGMLESVYQQAFAIALAADGLSFQREVWMDVEFMGQTLRHAFRADFVIEKYCIVELKSVESILAVHEKQLVTYLRLARLPLGYLVNFNSPLFRQGVKRFVDSRHAPPQAASRVREFAR